MAVLLSSILFTGACIREATTAEDTFLTPEIESATVSPSDPTPQPAPDPDAEELADDEPTSEPSPESKPTKPDVGYRAPDFKMRDPSGDTFNLSDLRRPILLNFWHTGCAPCRREMPYLQQLYDDMKGEGLIMLAINVGQQPSTVKQFLDHYDLHIPMILDTNGAIASMYLIQFFPTTFFIDKDGIVKEKVIGAFPSKEAIEEKLDNIVP